MEPTTHPIPRHLSPNKWGGNFEFEFCKNIDDKFNGSMPCITHSVALYAYLRRLQILLTLSRHQMLQSLFCVVPFIEVACKELFNIQQHCKEKIKLQFLIIPNSVLDLCFISIMIFIPFPWITQLCYRYIDLEHLSRHLPAQS